MKTNDSDHKRLYLIRHAESENNVAKEDARQAWHGIKRLDSLPSWRQLSSISSLLAVPMNTDLSIRGYRMAHELRSKMDDMEFLKNIRVELVLHSHLLRATRTCQILFERTGE